MKKNENISDRTGDDVEKKNKYLMNRLQKAEKIAIAFSGGVDSTFLLQSAYDVLGNNAIALTARSPLHPAPETEFAMAFAKQLGIRHYIIDTNEMAISAFVQNTHDRCYVCKKNLFRKISKISLAAGIETIAHGANLDDLDDFRPGFRAASEMGVVAPLIDACMTKQEIRILSKQMGLTTWDNPAMSCLATRIPYAVPITLKRLKMIEQAEAFIVSSGFKICRVRCHGEMARIEVPLDDMSKFQNIKYRKAIVKQLETIGFKYVAMDLEGYVQGSMNKDVEKGRQRK
jgi:uncharacterized protein